MPEEEMAYIGRKKCGCVVMVAVDMPDNARDSAKMIATSVRNGQTIERYSVEVVRKMKLGCPHREDGTLIPPQERLAVFAIDDPDAT